MGGNRREARKGRNVNDTPDWTKSTWQQALVRLAAEATPHVLVTIIEAKGSTPRPAGAKMVVAAVGQAGSIGGGTLEHRAVETARRLLAEGAAAPVMETHTLGVEQDQCCGGTTLLLFEPLTIPTLRLALFGAGHVGRALVRILEGTDVRVLWFDERASVADAMPGLGATVRIVADPAAEVAKLPADTHVLVMTHSHTRDFEIVHAALTRDGLASVGLIGAKTKWAHFRSQLAKAGIAEDRIVSVRCPIGLPGIGGKLPAEIAVSVAAELLSMRSANPAG